MINFCSDVYTLILHVPILRYTMLEMATMVSISTIFDLYKRIISLAFMFSLELQLQGVFVIVCWHAFILDFSRTLQDLMEEE